jgi:transposase
MRRIGSAAAEASVGAERFGDIAQRPDRRSTVKEYPNRAAQVGLSWAVAEGLSEEEVERRLFTTIQFRDTDRPVRDWEAVEQELRGRGVTLRLLWLEYLSRHPEGWRYTQFCEHFHAWQQRSRPPRMRQPHRAGAALEVDWAGMTLPVVDGGVAREAQVFVACLPSSDLIYAEATWTQGQEDWLAAHMRAFAYIGGCPETLVPDNTKTGVSEANYWDPVLNRSYHALARHYEVAIVPARVRKPRDKATVENAVRLVEMWVLAPLRHRQLLSLGEANAALIEKVEEFNNRPFAPPRQGSRRSLFETIERSKLKPLPAEPFVIGQWRVARVNIDYHIAVDGHFYSVPYRLVQQKLDIFVTASTVAVFHRGERVASHRRSAAKAQYTTLAEHIPRRTGRWPSARPSGCAPRPPGSALQSVLTSIGCSVHASTASRVSALVSACCGSPARMARSGWHWPASGRWPPVLSSRYVERLLKADLRRPFLDGGVEASLGEHANLRGSAYYN